MIKKAKKKLEDALYLSWEESERDWGVRPDGFSLHLSEDLARAYVESYWAEMPDRVPHTYSRPAGRPLQVKVSKELYRQIRKGNLGLRLNNENELTRKKDLIFFSPRTGQVF